MLIPLQSNRFRITLMLLVFALAMVLGSIGRTGRTESVEADSRVVIIQGSKAQPVASISWDGDAGDNLWHTKENWSGNQLPGSGDDVSIPAAASVTLTPSPEEGAVAAIRSLTCDGNLTIINSARLEFSADSSINGNLTLGSDAPLLSVGTLHGVVDGATQTMTLAGAFNWIGGTLSGDGMFNSTGGITISGGLGKELRGPTLNNSGTANWSGGGGIAIGSAGSNLGRFNNTGTFTANTDADFTLLGIAQGFFNEGNFVKSGTGTTSFLGGIPFHNSGIASINGILELRGGGASTGLFSPSASSEVRFTAGNYQLNNGATIGGAGFGVVAGATVTVSGNVTAHNFALVSGNLAGAGTLTVTSVLLWSGGTMSGTGVINVILTLEISGDAGKELFCTLNNAGTATWTGTGNIGMGLEAVFNNTGTFIAEALADFTHAGGTPASFNNQGNFNIPFSNSTGMTFSQNVAFNNTGMVTVESGSLTLDGGGTTVQPGAFDARLGAGVVISAGTYILDSAAFFGEGSFALIGGIVEVRGTVSMSNVFIQDGTLTGVGVLDVFGDLTWTGGTMAGTGVTNAEGGMVIIQNFGKILKRRTLNTRGTVTWSSSGNIGMEAEGGVGATFNNFGNFTALNNQFFGVVGASGSFNNFGTFTKSGSSGTTTFLVPVTNTGTASAASGIINFARGYNQAAGALILAGGSLSGTLDIGGGSLGGDGNTGSVNNTGGTTIVGASPGRLNITGNYTQGAAGVLAIEIGGTAAGTQFDQLNVSATATLGGALAITLINGFAPNPGDSFQILSYASRTGSFARIAGLVLPQGRVFTPSFTGNGLILITSAINDSQSGPTLTSATTSNGSTNIRGTFFGLPNTTYTISFFLNSTCDPSSPNQVFFGSTTVTTNASGNASFNVTFPTTVPPGQSITAIATGPNNSVSQFSQCITVDGVPTAIELASFTATSYDDGVLVEWQTGFEVDNLGFNIYREEAGNRVAVNKQLIAGSALVAGPRVAVEAGESYALWDSKIADYKTAAYWLEDVDLSGRSTWHGPFYATRVNSQPPAHSQAAPLTRLGLAQSNGASSRSVDAVASPSFVSPEQTAQQSWLASQPAVKITVKREGLYRISQPELVRSGLPAKVDPRFLQLFVEGREVPINVFTSPGGSFDETAAIEFYGMGLDTPSTNERTYWLIKGDKEGKRIAMAEEKGVLSSSQSFAHSVERRDRSIYFSSLRNGERENFFGPVVASSVVEQTLSLPHLHNSASEQAFLEVALQGVTIQPHRAMVELNGFQLGEVLFRNQEQGISKFALRHSMLREGANAVRLVSMNGPGDISLIDYLRIDYQHAFTADDDSLRFGVEGNERITIGGFSSNAIRVFDVTDEGQVTELKGEVTQAKNGYSITVAAAERGLRKLLALTDKAASKPDAVKANLVSSWRSANNQANFVIIAPREFFPAIEPLSMLRQSQGYRVALVDIEDIYDEFNFGNKSPQSIKEFLSVAHSNWNIKPGFVMFAADASFDSRNYLGLGSGDIVPTRLVDTAFLETASDDWLADFNNDGISDLAVGRLPARTLEEATSIVRKIAGYDPSKTVESALLVSDANDGFDFEQASAQLRLMLEPRLRVEELQRGRMDAGQAKARLIDAINRGQKIINYVGHGSVNQWRGNLLTSEEGRELRNESLPVIVMMTCLNGYFHDAALDSLAESLIKAERGGAVAAWSSSGLTLPREQAEMNKQFYRVLFETQNKGLSLGEAALKAKHSIGDLDTRRTWNLLGDPTMRFR